MKIAVWHNLPSGGAKRALYGQVAGLVARGHYVEAWCPETADDKYLPLSEIVNEHRLPFNVPRVSKGRAANFKSRLQLDHGPLLAEMNRHSRGCAEQILRGGFDLAFVAPCRIYIVPRLAHFLHGSGLPVALYLQEPHRVRYEAMPELPWLIPASVPGRPFSLRRARWRLGDFLSVNHLRAEARRELEDVRCYDLILVNSYFSRESVARVYGLDARVCYLGYDAARFHRIDPPPPRERFVMGLGSLHRHKGVHTAIDAMAHLPTPRPPLVWAANSEDPVYRRDMEALAAQKQVNFQVRNGIDDDGLVDLLNRTSLLLYTSHLEPFGYAPIEANACGAPVVAVAEGGIRETVVAGVTGSLCDRDPAALAHAMNRLLADPELAAQEGAAGAKIALEQWAPELATTRLENHLRNLLQSKPVDSSAAQPSTHQDCLACQS